MKPFIIIILLSLCYGLTSVYSQEINKDLKKNDLETKTELVSPDLRRANETPLPREVVNKPETLQESKSSSQQRVNNGPKANEPDPSRQAKQSKAVPASQIRSKSNTQGPKANEDPKKLK